MRKVWIYVNLQGEGLVAYSKEHYLAHKAEYAAKSKAWREANPERSKENRRNNYLLNKKANIEYATWYSLKRKFNLSKEEYLSKLSEQENVCAICGKTCTKSLAVDHNHETKKVRGLLCNNCNRGIGHLKEDKQILLNAIAYLEKWN